MKSGNVVDRVLVGMALGAIAGFIFCIRAWWKAKKEPTKVELTLKLDNPSVEKIETKPKREEEHINQIDAEKKAKLITEKLIILSPLIVVGFIILIIAVPILSTTPKTQTSQTNYNELPMPPPPLSPPSIQISNGNDIANKWFKEGIIHFKDKRYKDSIYALNKAIDNDPLFVRAFVQRGLAYRNIGIYDNAMTDLLFAIYCNPNDILPYVFMSWIYLDQGNKKEALEYINKAIKIDPLLDYLYRERGSIYANVGNYKEAHQDLNTAIKLETNNIKNYITRGRLYFNVNNYKAALTDFNRAVELDPQRADSYSFRAYIYEKLGKHQQAKHDRKIATKLKETGDKKQSLVTYP